MAQRELHYAIWLTPEVSVGTPLRSIINSLSTRFDTAPFSPHVTLCTGRWTEGINELTQHAGTLAQRLRPIKCTSNGIECRDTRFQFFYIALPDADFNIAQRLISALLPGAEWPPAGPHISLLYSDAFAAIEREGLKALVIPQLPEQIEFTALRLVIPSNNCWQDVAGWREVYTAPLIRH